MKKIILESEYLNITDTLYCGQVFRFKPHKHGFFVFSADKCAFCYNDEKNAVIECDESDEKYFYNYFDCERDYKSIIDKANQSCYQIVKDCAEMGKGIRILNQNQTETLFSFIVSQNNNIPRIKNTIEKLCEGLGEKKKFYDLEYNAFPSADAFNKASDEFLYSTGLGYRVPYVKKLAKDIKIGEFSVENIALLSTIELKNALTKLYGVGAKVADCVALFGYHRSDSFPVDTWIEKVYKQDFNGELTDRKKISDWFLKTFGQNAGYVQQYLFYYKRSNDKTVKKSVDQNNTHE